MLDGNASAELSFSSIPILKEAIALARDGVLSGGSKRNIESMEDMVDVNGLEAAERAVLFDAQTSGGLLLAVSGTKLDSLMEALSRRGVPAAHIGSLVAGDGRIRVTA
jgi:selenide,water dikinase